MERGIFKMKKIAFLITCFDEVNAIDVAITSLRQHYPDSTVNIFCEGDSSQFSNIADKHGANLFPSHDSQSCLLGLSESNYKKEDEPNVENAMMLLLDRIRTTAEFSQADYILLHCPDTLIRGKIDIKDGAGLLGSCVNKYFPERVNEVLVKYGGVRVDCFGAVPAIFNVQDFYKAYDLIRLHENILSELAAASCYAFSHDIFMSILFSLIGKNEEFNPQITECERNIGWMQSNCPIIHQFRCFYPKRTSKYKANEE
ncbi:hypothetical protein N9955_00955 [bacterium]|nr:hypothetical protein [bacterium]